MSEVIKLSFDGKDYNFPIIKGSEQEIAFDISKLRGQLGVITLDNGYKNTGSTISEITFIDGEKGILRYRGYDIEDLANNSDFIDVAYLLINGELPNKVQHSSFVKDINEHVMVNEDIRKILDCFPSSAHPMGVLCSVVSSLTAFHPNSLNISIDDMDSIYVDMVKLMAKMPTLCAWTYRKMKGLPFIYPDTKLPYVANFMNMLFSSPSGQYDIDYDLVGILEKLLILHADHEQNCSTSAVRMVGSSRATLYTSISSGISALWGPLHGGANQAVIEMLEMIKKDSANVKKYINLAKDKKSNFRLMGFGHRVYKNFDPRSKIIKNRVDYVFDKIGVKDPIVDIAREIEDIALNDEYFIEKKLYPNVDFYSGIVYRALGIPKEMFTVLFALGRLPGWLAQWKEMIIQNSPISRPRQVYQGYNRREYISMEDRKRK